MTGPPSPALLPWGRGVYGGPTQTGSGPGRRCHLPSRLCHLSKPLSSPRSGFLRPVCPPACLHPARLHPALSLCLSPLLSGRLSGILRAWRFSVSVPSCLPLSLFASIRLSSHLPSHPPSVCLSLSLPLSLNPLLPHLLLGLPLPPHSSSPGGPLASCGPLPSPFQGKGELGHPRGGVLPGTGAGQEGGGGRSGPVGVKA